MINVQHIRFGALTAVLSTVMLITVDESQSSAFAQNSTSTLNSSPITPAPETSDSDDDSSSSNDSDDDSNDESSGSTGSNDNDDNGDDGDSQQDTSTSSEEEDETEDDFEQTNPLLEQIRKSVSGALSATGIAVP